MNISKMVNPVHDNERKQVTFNCDYCGRIRKINTYIYNKSKKHYCSLYCSYNKNKKHYQILVGHCQVCLKKTRGRIELNEWSRADSFEKQVFRDEILCVDCKSKKAYGEI